MTAQVFDTAGFPINAAAAASIGAGLWRSIAPTQPGTYEFRVPEGEPRYAVAVSCPTGLQGTAKKVLLFYLTVDEATELRATCPATFERSATTVSGSFDASAVGGDRVDVYTSLDHDLGPGGTPAGAYGPLAIPAGSPQPIVALARDAAFGVEGVKVARDVTAAASLIENLAFGPGDAVGSVQLEDWSASVPSGFSASTILGLVVEGSQHVTLEGVATAVMPSVPTVPGMQSGDLYLVQSTASMTGVPTVVYATRQFQEDLSGLDLDLPDPWPVLPGVVGANPPRFTGLVPLPNEANHRGHVISMSWPGLPSVPPGPVNVGGYLQAFLSEGWLGSDTLFTMPDLTFVPAFPGAWPLVGETVTYVSTAISSSLDVATLLSSRPLPQGFSTGGLFPQPPPPVAGAVHRTGRVQGSFVLP